MLHQVGARRDRNEKGGRTDYARRETGIPRQTYVRHCLEIGNPLTSVFSLVNMLREMEHDEFKKETIETVYFHMKRIADILKQLSGFSKMPRWNSNCQR